MAGLSVWGSAEGPQHGAWPGVDGYYWIYYWSWCVGHEQVWAGSSVFKSVLSLCIWGQCDNFPRLPQVHLPVANLCQTLLPFCFFGNFWGLNCTCGRALQPDRSNVHSLLWQKQDINCLLDSQNILSLINGAKQHINLWYDTKLGCNISATLSCGTAEWICTSGEFFCASEEVLAEPKDCETTRQNTHNSQAVSNVTSDGKSHPFILVPSCQQIKVHLLQRKKPGACEQAGMVALAWVERFSHGFGQISLLQASNFHKGHLLL